MCELQQPLHILSSSLQTQFLFLSGCRFSHFIINGGFATAVFIKCQGLQTGKNFSQADKNRNDMQHIAGHDH